MSNEQRIPCKIVRRTLTPDADMVATFSVGKCDGIVLAVLIGNEGTNSRVKVGSAGGSDYKTIPDAGSMDISYGVSWPHYFEDDFKVVFTATGGSPIHAALVEIIIEKDC